jgi:3-methyl-2-oxobutanoate hydroxymethyltransferase
MKTIRLPHLFEMKQKGEKFCCLTVYDASFANIISELGVEIIFVGDSLGMVIQGHDSTVPVTVDDIVYHTKQVARGNRGSILMADLPFMSYSTTEQALHNAARLMAAGAHIVKLEGGAWLAPAVQALTERGIPVCGHLGLTPQSIHMLGGYKVQGREQSAAQRLREEAIALQDAGVQLLVLECVPSNLAKDISETLRIPVIGIGAGKDTDAQVLVLHDALGITPGRKPKFSKDFLTGNPAGVTGAIQQFIDDVKSTKFPAEEHEFV